MHFHIIFKTVIGVMSLLVCVPTYNEEESVKQVIHELRKENLEFIICDGFSKDRTVEIARNEGAEIMMRSKVGKGYAVTECLELAHKRGYTHMGTIDCDSTYSVKELKDLYDLAVEKSYHMVVGGRPFQNIAVHRRMANYFISGYFHLLFRTPVRDIISGSRILHVETFYNKIHADSFDLEPRLLAFSVKNKLNITEVPISYTDRLGESKANLTELAKILWGMTDEKLRR